MGSGHRGLWLRAGCAFLNQKVNDEMGPREVPMPGICTAHLCGWKAELHNKNLFPTLLKAGKSKVKVPTDLIEGSPLIGRQLLLCSHIKRRRADLSEPSPFPCEDTNP